jgi:ribose transport system permease protein
MSEGNTTARRQKGSLSRRITRWTGPAWVWAVLIGMAIIGSLWIPDFGSVNNFMNMLRQAVPLAIVAIGQTIVIVTAGIDLSVAAMVSMGNTMSMGIMDGGEGPILLAVLAPLAFGLAFGLVNGLLVAKTAAPAFIVTLGSAAVIQGIVFWYTDSATFGSPSPSFGKIGFETVGSVPLLVLLFVPLLIAALILQNLTRTGRHLYAVGDDDVVAQRAGVGVSRVKLFAYAASGLLAALAGLAVATRTGAGEPLAGMGFDWDSVAAAVIGGAVLTGGRGGVGGTIAGVLIIVMIDNAMTLQNVSSFWQSTVKGVIVLIAVIIAAVTAKDLASRMRATQPMQSLKEMLGRGEAPPQGPMTDGGTR